MKRSLIVLCISMIAVGFIGCPTWKERVLRKKSEFNVRTGYNDLQTAQAAELAKKQNKETEGVLINDRKKDVVMEFFGLKYYRFTVQACERDRQGEKKEIENCQRLVKMYAGPYTWRWREVDGIGFHEERVFINTLEADTEIEELETGFSFTAW